MVEVKAIELIGIAANQTQALNKFVRILASGQHLTIIDDIDPTEPGVNPIDSLEIAETSTEIAPT